MNWLIHCSDEALRAGVDPAVLSVLAAFGPGTHHPSLDVSDAQLSLVSPPLVVACSFDELERQITAIVDHLAKSLGRSLAAENTHWYAQRQVGIFHGLLGVLDQLSGSMEQARLLRVGFLGRLGEILASPLPRTLRIRSLVDFYFGQAALLAEHGAGLQRIGFDDCISGAQWRRVGLGMEHATVSASTTVGPIHINLLRARSARLSMRDCRDVPNDWTFERWVGDQGAIAGVSGGYFLKSEPNIEWPSKLNDPVGLLVSETRVVSPPSFSRSSLIQFTDGSIEIRQIGMAEVHISWVGGECLVGGLNRWDLAGQVPVAFNRAAFDRLPTHDRCSLAIVGSTVVEVGLGVTQVPLSGFTLILPDSRALAVRVGDEVSYDLPFLDGRKIENAMAGGPMIVSNDRPDKLPLDEDLAGSAPPATFVQDETLEQNLRPRMAVGIDAAGEILFAAVDGHDFERALGLTVRQTAHLMEVVGCVQATSLDGGSSKRMVVDGRRVDLAGARSSMRRGVRSFEVQTAVLVFPHNADPP